MYDALNDVCCFVENQSVSELIPTTPSQSKSNRERKSQKADKAMRVNNL